MEVQSSVFFPDEIWNLILLRLPIVPLFKFTCVSKQWKSIITDPKFGQDYLRRAVSTAKSSSSPQLWTMLYPFVNCHNDIDRSSKSVKDLIEILSDSRDNRDQLSPYVTFPSLPPSIMYPLNSHKILASSNGLILSLFTPIHCAYNFQIPGTPLLFVSNLLTKKSAQLPMPPSDFSSSVFGFAKLAGQYKVVLIRRLNQFSYRRRFENSVVEIFSSDTGCWTVLRLKCPETVLNSKYDEAFAYRGVLHWLDRDSRSILTYDPFHSPHQFGHIPLPDEKSTNLMTSDMNVKAFGMNVKASGMNLVYTGDELLLKYVEVDCIYVADQILSKVLCVWDLVDYHKGVWCLERRCELDLYWSRDWMARRHIPVALNPWSPDVLYYSYPLDNKVVGLDIGRGRKEFVYLFADDREALLRYGLSEHLIPLHLSPWSSPFYCQSRSN